MSLPTQIITIWRRWRSHRNGESVSLKALRKTLEELVPGIPSMQAQRDLTVAWEKNEDQMKEPVTLDSLAQALGRLRDDIARFGGNSAPSSAQSRRTMRGADPEVTVPMRRTL